MNQEIVTLTEDVTQSPLYSADLAPVPVEGRTWNKWNLAALWVGMAVCIPTYILASYMIKSGLSWQASLVIIGLANLVITVPMALNGHAGVRYGIPFPVIGRAAFGTKGIYAPSIVRGIVACGWFGVQTWIGGLAFYSIWNAVTGSQGETGLSAGKFIAFALFWIVNIYFIWKGTESIKWLEDYSAPILIVIGIVLIGWGWQSTGGFGRVLEQGAQLQHPTAILHKTEAGFMIELQPLKSLNTTTKASEYALWLPQISSAANTIEPNWQPISSDKILLSTANLAGVDTTGLLSQAKPVQLQLRMHDAATGKYVYSSIIQATLAKEEEVTSIVWKYILWFTAMVGFWATMSLSIADITRYAKSQRDQIIGQFIGLPGTMMFYSFVGIFVTCASILSFSDILVSEDAPWDPVTLVSKFHSPFVVVFAQIAMIIATLSTNIAANVIAPANVFANLFPKKISFRVGGVLSGLIGIVICPWLLLDEISNVLIVISGLLGPVLGIMLCDYFMLRKKILHVAELYKADGIYSYRSGYNPPAMIAMLAGVLLAVVGKWVPTLEPLFHLSWFTGFIVAFGVYYSLSRRS